MEKYWLKSFEALFYLEPAKSGHFQTLRILFKMVYFWGTCVIDRHVSRTVQVRWKLRSIFIVSSQKPVKHTEDAEFWSSIKFLSWQIYNTQSYLNDGSSTPQIHTLFLATRVHKMRVNFIQQFLTLAIAVFFYVNGQQTRTRQALGYHKSRKIDVLTYWHVSRDLCFCLRQDLLRKRSSRKNKREGLRLRDQLTNPKMKWSLFYQQYMSIFCSTLVAFGL